MSRRLLPILLLWFFAGACLPASGSQPAVRRHRTARHAAAAKSAEAGQERSRAMLRPAVGTHSSAHKRARPVLVAESSRWSPRRARLRTADARRADVRKEIVRRHESNSLAHSKRLPVVWASVDRAGHSGDREVDAQVSADDSTDQPQVRHNPKIHYTGREADPATTARNTRGPEQTGKSAAFVSSVMAAQKSNSSTTPALAAGAADEVADQSAESNQPDQSAPAPRPVLSQATHSGAVYVSSRSMPAGALAAPTAGRPHVPSVEEEVLTPTILPAIHPVLYNQRGRLVMPPAMKGTHAILVHQNTMADSEGLTRIQDDADLMRMREGRLLVPLPASAALRVDERLPVNRRYTRPWTEDFLATLSRAHFARFHTPLQVNSAVRTVAFQERLMRTNGNAAPAEGLTASPHLTGQAVDLAKHGLSLTEIAWLRGYLMPLVQEGKIDVEEEFQQSCFHISVYKSYLPARAPRRMIAEKHHNRTALLATALP